MKSKSSKSVDPRHLSKILKRRSSIYIQVDDPTHFEICFQIQDLFEDWHRESIFRDTPFSADRIEKVVNNLWDQKRNGLLLGAFESNKYASLSGRPLTSKPRLVGVLAARMGPHLFSDDWVATVEHWFVHPQYRTTTAAVKLLTGFRIWAKKNNCKSLVVPTNTGAKIKQTDQLLKKMGYILIGGTYGSSLSQ